MIKSLAVRQGLCDVMNYLAVLSTPSWVDCNHSEAMQRTFLSLEP